MFDVTLEYRGTVVVVCLFPGRVLLADPGGSSLRSNLRLAITLFSLRLISINYWAFVCPRRHVSGPLDLWHNSSADFPSYESCFLGSEIERSWGYHPRPTELASHELLRYAFLAFVSVRQPKQLQIVYAKRRNVGAQRCSSEASSRGGRRGSGGIPPGTLEFAPYSSLHEPHCCKSYASLGPSYEPIFPEGDPQTTRARFAQAFI
jgi:hypothetical protein